MSEKTPNAEQLIKEEQREFFKLLRAAELVCKIDTETEDGPHLNYRDTIDIAAPLL